MPYWLLRALREQAALEADDNLSAAAKASRHAEIAARIAELEQQQAPLESGPKSESLTPESCEP